MVEEIHKNDIDTKFLVTIKDRTTIVDISSTTTKEIIFKKSDGTVVTKIATLETDGTDGKMYYKSLADDLNMSGSWMLQGKVVIGTGTWKSSIGLFTVYDNLE